MMRFAAQSSQPSLTTQRKMASMRQLSRWFGLTVSLVVASACASAGEALADPASSNLASSTYYFSDCRPGSAAGCVPGDDNQSGRTPQQAKRTLRSIDVNRLPPGSHLLFAKGGVWEDFNLLLHNLNVTAEQPLVIDSYAPPWGGQTAPWLKAGGTFYAFQFGPHGDKLPDGGYTIRNLKLDGQGKQGAWGIHLRNNVHDVVLENLEITGFELAIHSLHSESSGNTRVVVRNAKIHRNSSMGFLGEAHELLIENSSFSENNFSGSPFSHAIYLTSVGHDVVIRNNTFTNNSVAPSGICTGGNLTIHGQWDGLLIEGNLISQDKANGGCYGMSITPSYTSVEWFRNTVVRGNTIINLGGCSICAASAPGIVIEDNRIVNEFTEYHAAILIPERPPGEGDAADGEALVRNNTIYLPRAGSHSVGINLRSGSKNRIVSNLIYFGSNAHPTHACFVLGPTTASSEIAGNLCHHASGAGTWSREIDTLAQAIAVGLDRGGQSTDPLLATIPTRANGGACKLKPGSPALSGGHPALSSARAQSALRGKPLVGACAPPAP